MFGGDLPHWLVLWITLCTLVRCQASKGCPYDEDANISEACKKSMAVYHAAQNNKTDWALMMSDADSTIDPPPPGTRFGNWYALGAFDQCYLVKATYKSVYSSKNGSNVLIGLHDFDSKYCKLGSGRGKGLWYGVCVPSTCNDTDVGTLCMTEKVRAANGSVDCWKKPEIKNDGAAIASIVVLSIFGALVVIATLFDYITGKMEEKRKAVDEKPPPAEQPAQINTVCDSKDTAGSQEMKRFVGASENELIENKDKREFNLVKPKENKNNSKLTRALLAFSLCKNLPPLFSAKSPRGAYKCMNGLRVLAMSWVVLGHSWVNTNPTLSNPLMQRYLRPRFLHQIVNRMSLATDVFFLLSGCLIMISFLKTVARTAVEIKGQTKCRKALRIVKEYALYVFHRYWRLTPIVAVLMLFMANIYIYMIDGPLFPEDYDMTRNCKANWWINLIYLENFLEIDNMCLRGVWYLAVDFQFYLLLPVHTLLFHWSPIAGGVFACVCWVVNLILRFVLKIRGFENGYLEYYIVPYTRYGPYLMGMGLGYLFYRTKGKVKLPTWGVIGGWCLTIVFLFFAIFGAYKRDCAPNDEDCLGWPGALNHFYIACYRDIFSFSITWIILCCVTGYGGLVNSFLSWGLWIPLAKVTYIGYLIHMMIMDFAIHTRRELLYMQDITIIYLFIGNLMLSFVIGFGLTLVFEIPFLHLERIILPQKKKTT